MLLDGNVRVGVVRFQIVNVGFVLRRIGGVVIAIKPDTDDARADERNVMGGALAPCSTDPMTGFYRNGCCSTGPEDAGSHTVCAVMTDAFLAFSRSRGNDLTTPRPDRGFPGLRAGDRWCLCAVRWLEAYEAGCAPGVVLGATHERALDVIDRAALEAHALDHG